MDRRREQPSIVIDKVLPLEAAADTVRGPVVLQLRADQLSPELEEGLARVFEAHPGETRMRMEVKNGGRSRVLFELADGFNLDPTPEAVGALRELLGPGAIRFDRK